MTEPPYSRSEIIAMITAEGAAQRQLHARAAEARAAAFGTSVVVRGVIEITNVCRVNCDYCQMRRDNTRQNVTYTMDREEILSAVRAIRDAGLNIVFFQGGEIPQTTALVASLIAEVRAMFDDRVEILLGLGVKKVAEYRQLKDLGASSYIVKHETSDETLHSQIRGEPLSVRLEAIRTLQSLGYRVGTGCIVGLPGQSVESLADDALVAWAMGVDMCSASPFVPTVDTPLVNAPAGSVSRTLNLIAAMRLMNPRWLISSVSALQQRTAGGQLAGLRAGANVMTINFTPTARRQDYLIYGPTRHVVTAQHVNEQLTTAGLTARGSIWM